MSQFESVKTPNQMFIKSTFNIIVEQPGFINFQHFDRSFFTSLSKSFAASSITYMAKIETKIETNFLLFTKSGVQINPYSFETTIEPADDDRIIRGVWQSSSSEVVFDHENKNDHLHGVFPFARGVQNQ